MDFNSNESYENAYRTNYATYGYEGVLITMLTTGEGFKSIGTTCNNNTEKGSCFEGVFNGNGKTISNLNIKKEGKIETEIGLFSGNHGEIKNLGIKNCNININCSENPNKWLSCGAICGYNNGEIINCWASGNIEIIWNDDSNISIGGIVGAGSNKINEEATVSNCYNKINLNVVMNLSNSILVGGVVGSSNGIQVNNCYNVGSVKGENKGTEQFYLGGVLGSSIVDVSRCYNLGTLEGKMLLGNPTIGGVAGGTGYGKVEYCCNTGKITYEGPSARRVGTLLGLIEGTLENSHSLKDAELNGIGRNYSSTSEPTKVDTIEEMPTVLEIMGDEFKADTNNINDGYPIFNWQ